MSDWSPTQYNRFQRERQAPFFDLLELVEPVSDARVVDLGCGTGELTRLLHDHLKAASTVGLDSSPAMLESARAQATAGLSFVRADIAREPSTTTEGAIRGPFDLIFSNAALHWIEDHPAQLARLADLLAPNGQLALQVPASFEHPSHLSARDAAREPVFASALGGWEHAVNLLTLEGYALLLHRLGFREQHVRAQIYGHVLESRESVVDWFQGSLLVPYRQRLSAELYARFVERYRERLFDALADDRPFFFPMKRILLWARR